MQCHSLITWSVDELQIEEVVIAHALEVVVDIEQVNVAKQDEGGYGDQVQGGRGRTGMDTTPSKFIPGPPQVGKRSQSTSREWSVCASGGVSAGGG